METEIPEGLESQGYLKDRGFSGTTQQWARDWVGTKRLRKGRRKVGSQVDCRPEEGPVGPLLFDGPVSPVSPFHHSLWGPVVKSPPGSLRFRQTLRVSL